MDARLLTLLKTGMAALLFLCLLNMPYGYFMLVRTVAMICFGVFALTEYQAGRIPSMILFIGLAILFQPLLKISLGRELWNIVDVVVGIGLLGWAVAGWKSKS